MYIKKYDTSTDMEEIKKKLDRRDPLCQELLKAIASSSEGIYIAYCANEIIGFLSLNSFNKRRITPYVYVDEKYRRKKIGTELLQLSDQIISNSYFEHAFCEFTADEDVVKFLTKNGYRCFSHEFNMERDNTLIDSDKLSDKSLLEKGIIIRNYKDDDYIAWHNISDVAFFLMREKLGLTPSYYYLPSKSERIRFANNVTNKYVMVVEGVIVAICIVIDNEIHLLAVRPDLQSHGYGRIMVSYMNNMIITEQHPQEVKISVTDGNPAKRLYHSLGFREVRYLYCYVKYYKPDSRQSAPKGYTTEEEILNEFRLHGMLKEEIIS